MPKVSIIIPVYNVEQYLRRCVNSVLGQTVDNIEIILVDDGSPDNCPLICDQYKEQDSRVKVVHKKNGGLASARNAGLKIASGEYILFVDSDDWIDPETVEELCNIAEKYRVDFVRFRPMYAGWPNHADGELCDFGTETGMREGLYKQSDMTEEIYPRLFATPELTLGVIVAAWRSLYSHAFLKENNILFDEEIRYSEDTIFSAKVVVASQSFFYLDGPRYYHYFYNHKSITKSYKKDYWENNKKLIQCFEREYGKYKRYDFLEQLWLQKIYCIVEALRHREAFPEMWEKEAYCFEICNDPITVKSMKHLRLIRVSWKVYFFCMLIKLKWSKVIARI